MELAIEPELGIPVELGKIKFSFEDKAKATAKTATMLSEYGLNIVPDRETDDIAAKIALSYAENPEYVTKEINNKRISSLPPAALITTYNILNEFGHSVVESAVQVRHLVTNKLIEETENSDPRVRIRALELLGKISDVGLFAEKSEVTITHQTTDELKERLRSKLALLINPERQYATSVVLDGEAIDINAELGLLEPSDDE